MENNNENLMKLTTGLLIAVFFILIFNVVSINRLNNATLQMYGSNVAGNTMGNNMGGAQSQTYIAGVDVLPKGMPRIYGAELGVKYDDVSASNPQFADATIGRLGVLDNKLSLTGDDLKRYISITSKISCEYCCGAESIIMSNGAPACGCSHSYAMRGIAKYLIKYHPKEFSDDEILEELGKWKTLFFPEKLSQKAGVLKSKGIELNYINLASNKYRDIEAGAGNSGQMVGGC